MSEKLVRDNIPEIIRKNGKTPVTRVLDDKEYLSALDDKLSEEVAEYLFAKDLDELADVIEVIRAIALARGSSIEQIETTREEKLEKRGGFTNRTALISE